MKFFVMIPDTFLDVPRTRERVPRAGGSSFECGCLEKDPVHAAQEEPPRMYRPR
jgi:hypothetical protein